MTETSDTGPSVDTALSVWRQGDCVVGEQWFVFRRSDGDEGLEEHPVPGLVVVSQTCDVVRSVGERPFVEVAPLVVVASDQLEGIRRGRQLRYAHVPGVADRALVADLDRTMTVHKELVAGWTRLVGCPTDPDVRRFAEMLARKRRRFAFPDDFNAMVGKLQQRFKDKHDKQSDEGGALKALLEIRVQARPSWGVKPISVDLFLLCTAESKAMVAAQREAWLELVKPTGVYTSVDLLVLTHDELTAAQYVASDPLDLENLSWAAV